MSGAAGRGSGPVWTGDWVAARLGVRLVAESGPAGARLTDLVGLAVRRNPRRAHLLVSTVLGKHVPTDPRLVYGAGLLLGFLVRCALPDATRVPVGEAPSGDAPDAVPAAVPAAVRDDFAAALAGRPGAAGRLCDRLTTAAVRATGPADRAAVPPVQAAGVSAPTGPSSRAAVPSGSTVVIGYAETATALGHCVADALDAAYLHSTRRPVPGVRPYGGFEEEHSHATGHLLLPADPSLLGSADLIVLVDDELSTGTTALNTVRALHALRPAGSPPPRYVIAALVDVRGPADRARTEALAAELGAPIDTVALAAGRVELPAEILEAGRRLVTEVTQTAGTDSSTVQSSETEPPDGQAPRFSGRKPPAVQAARPAGVRHAVGPMGALVRCELDWPAGLPDGGRHGFTPRHRERLGEELPRLTAQLAEAVRPLLPAATPRILVLGFEELMYLPLRLAESLAAVFGHAQVRYSTTTRSPVLPVDDPGYAIRTRLAFPAHDDPADGPGERYAYNVAPGAGAGARRFDAIVLVVDDTATGRALDDGLLTLLRASGAPVALAVVPSWTPDGREETP